MFSSRGPGNGANNVAAAAAGASAQDVAAMAEYLTASYLSEWVRLPSSV